MCFYETVSVDFEYIPMEENSILKFTFSEKINNFTTDCITGWKNTIFDLCRANCEELTHQRWSHSWDKKEIFWIFVSELLYS